MVIENKKVAIVGGGPGGLVLARILQQRGGNVTVYERDADPDVRVQGGTLDLHEESGLRALLEAGVDGSFPGSLPARCRPADADRPDSSHRMGRERGC